MGDLRFRNTAVAQRTSGIGRSYSRSRRQEPVDAIRAQAGLLVPSDCNWKNERCKNLTGSTPMVLTTKNEGLIRQFAKIFVIYLIFYNKEYVRNNLKM